MLKKLFVFTSLTCLTIVSIPQSSQALTCGTWKEADKSIRWWWGKAYPDEKILSVDQNGPPQTYSKVQSTNQKKIDEYGNEWEYYQNNPYCRVPAKVKVQQSSSQRIFNVSAIFKVSGKKFTFDDVATGGSEAVLAPGQAEAPDINVIKQLIIEKVVSSIPPDLQANIKVDKVMIASRELRDLGNGQSAYSMASADLYLIEDGKSKKKCEIAPLTLYKGEEKNMRLDAGGPWKIQLSKDVPSRCVEFKYWSKVYNYANHIEEKAPPVVDSSWMKDVIGVYKGDIQGDVYNAVTTSFTMDTGGKMSGTFDYTERKKHVTGTISDCMAIRINEAKCKWQDQEDKGELRFFFAKNHSSFTGRWWDKVEDRSNKWDGNKTSDATPIPKSEVKASDVAPTPNIKNPFKGFGF